MTFPKFVYNKRSRFVCTKYNRDRLKLAQISVARPILYALGMKL